MRRLDVVLCPSMAAVDDDILDRVVLFPSTGDAPADDILDLVDVVVLCPSMGDADDIRDLDDAGVQRPSMGDAGGAILDLGVEQWPSMTADDDILEPADRRDEGVDRFRAARCVRAAAAVVVVVVVVVVAGASQDALRLLPLAEALNRQEGNAKCGARSAVSLHNITIIYQKIPHGDFFSELLLKN
ncbi:hypothetical protein ONE63_007404 [Megalurothrips usitatus]|uniref:Uncharacterized protein n=1 Tax=Megalurothrips usitatus TaxID=439358 RepID=A0AAV7XML9_9NEOP|nr:hypothetical protein ONE63_007404 [Megalurothrips usitatus]